MDPWILSEEALCRELQTNRKKGLSAAEAQLRLEKDGPNQLPEAKQISPLRIFFKQFQNLIIWVLIAAAFISGVLREWLDAGAIAVIVILNALLGFFQEYQAEKSLAALKKLSNPHSYVIRDGAVVKIDSCQIVAGDVVRLEAGDKIPADGRLVHAAQFRVQEASLTGESVPVEKNSAILKKQEAALADRLNMVFMGTTAVGGRSEMIVTATGLKTELGKIAFMLQSGTEEKTPLQIQLEDLGRKLVFIFLAVVAAVFALGVARGNPWGEMLLTSLSLAVAAIPEGLPAVVTIALAIGVRKMAKRNALIRRLPSVETLGCASVICSDKTGTLTQNEMTVRHLWTAGRLFDISGTGYVPAGEFRENGVAADFHKSHELSEALRIAVLCNGASLQKTETVWTIAGDPTEAALLVAGAKAGLRKEELEEKNPLEIEIPFDSDRKQMSMVRKTHKGLMLYSKGAPDILLKRCTNMLTGDGEEVPLTREVISEIKEANHRFASKALRVLAVAYRPVGSEENLRPESLESQLVFAGLFAMMDPPRPEAKRAIEICRKAGITPVMITGDHRETALAVGKELGLLSKDSAALDGAELDALSEEQLIKRVPEISVFARVSAEHKFKIIKAWKKNGAVVAMTGDGVNDAPALKEADIGIAMGITGTDVTKEASDMVILDDNFASIVSAVEEGRAIYDNISKFVNYLLSSNIAEILVLFCGMLIGMKDGAGNIFIPLSAVQILWMNLVTDGLPAVALSMDPVSPDAMKRPPRQPSRPVLTAELWLKMVSVSLCIAAGALSAAWFGLARSPELAQTMALTTLILLQLARVQMVRASYKMNLFCNPWLLAALGVSLGLQVLIVYVPVLQEVFGTTALSIPDWLYIFCAVAVVWFSGTLLTKFIDKISSR